MENEEHCDFVKLREALLRVNVEDLRERTQRNLYENFRRSRLAEMGVRDGDLGPNMAQKYAEVSLSSVLLLLSSKALHESERR